MAYTPDYTEDDLQNGIFDLGVGALVTTSALIGVILLGVVVIIAKRSMTR